MHTHFQAFFKIFLKKFSPSLVPTGENEIIGCFFKIFFTKDPFTHLDKGGQNAHPFLRFSMKKFYLSKRPPHLFGIAQPNDTLFFRKNKNIFSSVARLSYFCLPKKSLYLFGIRIPKRNLFLKIFEIFLKEFFVSKNTSSLVHSGRWYLGIVILKKGKKITSARKQTHKSRTNPCGNIFEIALIFLFSQHLI